MKPYLKWTAISVGSIVAIAHIGVLGHLVRRAPDRVQVPTINIPRGTPYSSYKIEAGKDGYSIEYRANDPKILESQRSLDLNKSQSGFFGGKKYEEWYRIKGKEKIKGTISFKLPEGSTHYYLNLIDENNFLVSYPETPDYSKLGKTKEKFAKFAITRK